MDPLTFIYFLIKNKPHQFEIPSCLYRRMYFAKVLLKKFNTNFPHYSDGCNLSIHRNNSVAYKWVKDWWWDRSKMEWNVQSNCVKLHLIGIQLISPFRLTKRPSNVWNNKSIVAWDLWEVAPTCWNQTSLTSIS